MHVGDARKTAQYLILTVMRVLVSLPTCVCQDVSV